MKLPNTLGRFTSMRAPLWSRLVIVLVLTAASGVVAGSAGNRWASPDDLLAAGKKIDHVPSELGDWKLQSAEHLDEAAVELLQCTGSTQRVYQNAKSGAIVRMAFFVGPPGPTSVHTPDVCFTGANYEVDQAATQLLIPVRKGLKASFSSGTFRSKDLAGDSLRVLYSWNSDGRWVAPRYPRLEFAGSSVLYKLMVVTTINRGAASPDDVGICRDFLKQLLPELDSILLRSSD